MAITQTIPTMRYRPNADGLERWFGPLEAEIMTIVWRIGAPTTIKKVWRTIVDTRPLAYTTVMTTMGRLVEKGLLTAEKRGIAYIYTPTCSQAEFEGFQVQAIAASLARPS